MDDPIRVLLADLPRLPRELLGRAIAERPELELVTATGESLEHTLEAARSDVLVVGRLHVDPADAFGPLLRRLPALRVLALTSDGRRAYLYELRPHRLALGEVSAPDVAALLVRRDPPPATAPGPGGD